MIARRGKRGRAHVFRRDIGPLGERAADPYRLWRGRARQQWRALISAHVPDKLPVVVIAMAAAHWLDIAAVLLVELVDELRSAAGLAPSSCDPLVPAGHHHERRVQRDGAFPLLAEVQAEVHP